MIISRKDEGMAVARQGLTGDLVIFLDVWGDERQYFTLCLWKIGERRADT